MAKREGGSREFQKEKTNHRNTIPLLVTAIGLASEKKYSSPKIVLGLPISDYKKQAQQFERTVVGNYQIELSNKELSIELHHSKVLSFPEGAGILWDQLLNALKQAVKERLIPNNVADPVEPPPKKSKEVKTYNLEQIKKLLKIAKSKNSRIYTAILLELTTGLRRGEILGLKWEDISFQEGILTVRRQLLPTREEGLILKEPKTESSKRSIVLTDNILLALKSHKIKQNEYKLLLGQAYKNNDLVFCREDGEPWRSRSLIKAFKKTIKEAKLPDICFHDLRHTFATISLEAGVSAKAIQEILGHSSISDCTAKSLK